LSPWLRHPTLYRSGAPEPFVRLSANSVPDAARPNGPDTLLACWHAGCFAEAKAATPRAAHDFWNTEAQRMIDRGKRSVLGIGIDVVDYDGAAKRIMAAAHEGRPYSVSALAVHGVMTGAL